VEYEIDNTAKDYMQIKGQEREEILIKIQNFALFSQLHANLARISILYSVWYI
jgi:hypothetical protein